MPRTNLNVAPLNRAGVFEPGVASTVDGHMFGNDGQTFVEVQNSSATVAHSVTIVTGGTSEGLAVADVVVPLPVSSRRLIGPFPKETFDQPSGADRGRVYLNYSAAAADLVARAYRV